MGDGLFVVGDEPLTSRQQGIGSHLGRHLPALRFPSHPHHHLIHHHHPFSTSASVLDTLALCWILPSAVILSAMSSSAPLQVQVRLLYRAPSTKQPHEKASDKDAAKHSHRSAKHKPSSSTPSLSSSSLPPSSSSSSSSSLTPTPMDDSSSTPLNPLLPDSPFPSHTLLLLHADRSSTFQQLKAELSLLPVCSPTASLTLLYHGRVMPSTDSLGDRLREDLPCLTAIAVEPPPLPPTPSLGPPSTLHSASSSSSSSSSHLSPHPSSSSSSPRRPSPEQILSELNRLITPDTLHPLLDMGFSESRAIKALIRSLLNPELAISWLLEHADDPDIDDPLTPHQLYQIASAFHLLPSPGIEECVRNGVCTFTLTQRQYAPQQYYLCHTCGLTGGRGCCVSCAGVCHAGHEVEGPINSESFFCDCGAGDGGVVCRAVRAQGAAADAAEAAEAAKAKAKEKEREEEERKAKEKAPPVKPPRRFNEVVVLNDVDPYDYVASLTFFLDLPPLPSLTLPPGALLRLAELLNRGADDRTVRLWCAEHAGEVYDWLHVTVAGSWRSAMPLMSQAFAFLPVQPSAVVARVQEVLAQVQYHTLTAADCELLLPLFINLFSSRPALQVLPTIFPALLNLSLHLTSTRPPLTARNLHARLLFNLCLLLRLSGEVLPDFLSLLIHVLRAESDEPTARILIQALTVYLFSAKKEVRLLALRMGIGTATESIIARKAERASPFAQLLMRIVRA